MEPELKTSRVLVADDDQSIRQLVCTIVKREKLEVDCVGDGIEAIELIKSREYSVILLDLMMPRASGFDVIEYLKQNPPRWKPIVLVITAYADQKFQEVDPSIVAGVIRKPFEVAEVGKLISLCDAGFHDQLSTKLAQSGDRAIGEVAEQVPTRDADFESSAPQRDGRRSH